MFYVKDIYWKIKQVLGFYLNPISHSVSVYIDRKYPQYSLRYNAGRYWMDSFAYYYRVTQNPIKPAP